MPRLASSLLQHPWLQPGIPWDGGEQGPSPWGAVGCGGGVISLGKLCGAAWLQAQGSSSGSPMLVQSTHGSVLAASVLPQHVLGSTGGCCGDGSRPSVHCSRPDESLQVLTSPWTAVWVKICSSWAGLLLYLWTLVAPLVLPDRDFS